MYWGGKWTEKLTTLGPYQGSQHSHWFPWGSDLPGQGQASDRNQLCRLLYTFQTLFCDSFHICIYATSSHILTCNIQKCYRDYFLCRLIYTYPYTINLMYYNTMVLIMKNYFLIRYLTWYILLYVKPIWCSGVPEVYAGLGHISAMGICAFLCNGIPEIYC